MVVGSNPVDGSILYTQIRNHPSSLSCVLAVAPTMKRSAVQPKTTRLCSSIRVISLWLQGSGQAFPPQTKYTLYKYFNLIEFKLNKEHKNLALLFTLWDFKINIFDLRKKKLIILRLLFYLRVIWRKASNLKFGFDRSFKFGFKYSSLRILKKKKNIKNSNIFFKQNNYAGKEIWSKIKKFEVVIPL